MWEKIAKEMQLPWRAAEAMHWQIGEAEMAQRANVPVFHLAGQQSSSASGVPERAESLSPSSASGHPPLLPYPPLHNHTLPQIPISHSQPLSPVETRLRSNSNSSVSPPTGHQPLRRRADSARPLLPSVGELTGAAAPPFAYSLPPVVTSPDTMRR